MKSPGPTKVAELATITPPFFSPMNAMKSPTPQVTAIFSAEGIEAMIFSRIPGDRERQEDDAVDEDHAEGLAPGHALRQADREREEGVDPHPRRHGDRVVGEQRHERRRDGGRYRGHRDQRALVHARVGQDGRVDGEDVGHRGEGRQPRLELPEGRRAATFELEEARYHASAAGLGVCGGFGPVRATQVFGSKFRRRREEWAP